MFILPILPHCYNVNFNIVKYHKFSGSVVDYVQYVSALVAHRSRTSFHFHNVYWPEDCGSFIMLNQLIRKSSSFSPAFNRMHVLKKFVILKREKE